MNTQKRGRPKVRASKARSCAVRVALTPTEYAELKRTAAERGVSMSHVARERLLIRDV